MNAPAGDPQGSSAPHFSQPHIPEQPAPPLGIRPVLVPDFIHKKPPLESQNAPCNDRNHPIRGDVPPEHDQSRTPHPTVPGASPPTRTNKPTQQRPVQKVPLPQTRIAHEPVPGFHVNIQNTSPIQNAQTVQTVGDDSPAVGSLVAKLVEMIENGLTAHNKRKDHGARIGKSEDLPKHTAGSSPPDDDPPPRWKITDTTRRQKSCGNDSSSTYAYGHASSRARSRS